MKAGKARYVGISNCFAYQLAKANALAEKEGFPKFVSIQGHYNLIFREEEREMAQALRRGQHRHDALQRLGWGQALQAPRERPPSGWRRTATPSLSTTLPPSRMGSSSAGWRNWRSTHGVTMTEISLAWLLQKVTAPVVGATKLHHIEGAAKAVELELSPQEMAYLEEPYVPHKLVGVMAQNTPAAAGTKQVWTVK